MYIGDWDIFCYMGTVCEVGDLFVRKNGVEYFYRVYNIGVMMYIKNRRVFVFKM